MSTACEVISEEILSFGEEIVENNVICFPEIQKIVFIQKAKEVVVVCDVETGRTQILKDFSSSSRTNGTGPLTNRKIILTKWDHRTILISRRNTIQKYDVQTCSELESYDTRFGGDEEHIESILNIDVERILILKGSNFYVFSISSDELQKQSPYGFFRHEEGDQLILFPCNSLEKFSIHQTFFSVLFSSMGVAHFHHNIRTYQIEPSFSVTTNRHFNRWAIIREAQTNPEHYRTPMIGVICSNDKEYGVMVSDYRILVKEIRTKKDICEIRHEFDKASIHRISFFLYSSSSTSSQQSRKNGDKSIHILFCLLDREMVIYQISLLDNENENETSKSKIVKLRSVTLEDKQVKMTLYNYNAMTGQAEILVVNDEGKRKLEMLRIRGLPKDYDIIDHEDTKERVKFLVDSVCKEGDIVFNLTNVQERKTFGVFKCTRSFLML